VEGGRGGGREGGREGGETLTWNAVAIVSYIEKRRRVMSREHILNRRYCELR